MKAEEIILGKRYLAEDHRVKAIVTPYSMLVGVFACQVDEILYNAGYSSPVEGGHWHFTSSEIITEWEEEPKKPIPKIRKIRGRIQQKMG